MRVMPSPGITEVQLNPVEPMIDRELPIGLPQYNGHPYYPFNGNAQYDFQTDNRPDASNIGFVPQPLYQTALNPEINVERPSPPEVPGGATLDTRQAAQKGLSILDVPFPASLDSNAIGWNASHAPLAKSAPGRAGMPMSSPKVLTPALAKDIWDNSPFAPNSPGSAKYSRALSPQNLGESLFARRQISSQRVQAADGSSSSVPRLGKISNFDDINETMVEEDFIPDSLQDLLTPAEKSRRRYSGREDEPSGLKKRVDSFGSMSATSLSSQRPTSPNYGPIGSPLRNSSMPFPESRTFSGQNKAPTNGVGHAQGPAQPSQQPPQRTPRLIAIPATPNISALSSQLKRVRLNRENGNMLLRPSLAETLAGDSQPSPQRAQTCGSGGTDGVGAERFRGRRDDMSPQRASSVLSDEEVFSMDVEHP